MKLYAMCTLHETGWGTRAGISDRKSSLLGESTPTLIGYLHLCRSRSYRRLERRRQGERRGRGAGVLSGSAWDAQGRRVRDVGWGGQGGVSAVVIQIPRSSFPALRTIDEPGHSHI